MILFEISKGVYGLPEAGKLAQDRLYAHLQEHGYYLINGSTGMFRHKTRPTIFSLVVDDFGVQYSSVEDVNHLADTLRKLYKITMDWTGSKYLGLTIRHDEVEKTMSISMPTYIAKILERFEIEQEGKPYYSPAKYECTFLRDAQLTETDNSPMISEVQQKRVQEIVGYLLYYARAVDPTMLCDTNRLGSQQAIPTERHMMHCNIY